MIFSEHRGFIFFAVPKTATHAIRRALRPYLGAMDWEQQALFQKMVSPIPEIARLEHGHITAQEIRTVICEKQWQAMLKFAVVRNPFDRFVSVCAFLNRDNPDFDVQAVDWMKRALQRSRFQQRILVRPQVRQLCDEKGTLLTDRLLRYESLDQDFNALLDTLSLTNTRLESTNRSDHQPYAHYYQDSELAELVRELYREDFKTLSYADSV